MNRYFGFVVKEWRHIFRDYRSMLILFGIPILQILIFGFVISTDIQDIPIGILDKSKDVTTNKIISSLLSSGYYKYKCELKNESEIADLFKKGKIKEAIIFESEFGNKLQKEKKANIQLIADASDPNTANLIVNYTSGIINKTIKNSLKQPDNLLPVQGEVRMYFNQGLKGIFMFVPGTIAIILILISTLMTSVSITREKEFGSMEVILVSPLKPIEIIAGKITPYLLFAFINALTIISMGYFIFGLPMQGNLFLLLLLSLLYIALALSLGIFISTIVSTQQIAIFISQFALILPTMLLSGFIFPIENMPKILQAISFFMPPKYFIIALKNIMIKGTGIEFIWKEVCILLLFTFVFITLSILKFKSRLD